MEGPTLMKTLFRILILSTLAIACAWPDMSPPPPKGERIKMQISRDNTAVGGPVLEIPARLLRQHAGLIGDDSDRIRMLAAGVLLSAAIFFAGSWFWKRRERLALVAGPTPSTAGPAIPATLPPVALPAAGAPLPAPPAAATRRSDAPHPVLA